MSHSAGASPSITQLAQALVQFAQARDWQPFHSPKNLASALTVEAAELLEHFQWLTEAQSRQLDEAKREAVALEMADVLLYLVQLANQLNIDLMDAAQRKMVINAQRFPVPAHKAPGCCPDPDPHSPGEG